MGILWSNILILFAEGAGRNERGWEVYQGVSAHSRKRITHAEGRITAGLLFIPRSICSGSYVVIVEVAHNLPPPSGSLPWSPTFSRPLLGQVPVVFYRIRLFVLIIKNKLSNNLRTPISVVVSHIQRIGCQPEKTTLHGGQSRSWSAEQGKENQKKVWQHTPPPHPPHCSFGENK